MTEPVRRLTKAGQGAFRDFLNQLRDGRATEPPRALLTDPDASEVFVPFRSIEQRPFANRLEAARYLAEVFDGVDDILEDVGLWSWLSLFFFEQTCPLKTDGKRSPGKVYRHILDPRFPHGHRHLLNGPFLVFRMHGELGVLLLCSKVHVENSFHHDFMSRQALVANPVILKVANRLYLDKHGRAPKRGAQDSSRGAGTLRRFIDVMQQLDLNYDLYSMKENAILELLPEEFDGWRRPTGILRRK